MDRVTYCKDATKLLKKSVICGKDCPIYGDCPRLIMEDANDKAIGRAIKRLLELTNEKK